MTNLIGKKANCENCGKEFELHRTRQRFCSSSCRFIDWDLHHPRARVAQPPDGRTAPDVGRVNRKER